MKDNKEKSIRTIIRRVSDRALQSFASETCMPDEEDSQDLDYCNELIMPLREISKTITSKANDVWQHAGTTKPFQERIMDATVCKGASCSSKEKLKNKYEKPNVANKQYPPEDTKQIEYSNTQHNRINCKKNSDNIFKKRPSFEKRPTAILKDKNGYRWADIIDASDAPSRYENIRSAQMD